MQLRDSIIRSASGTAVEINGVNADSVTVKRPDQIQSSWNMPTYRIFGE